MPYYTRVRGQQAERTEPGQEKQRFLMGCSWRIHCAVHRRCHVRIDQASTASEESKIRVHGGRRQACMSILYSSLRPSWLIAIDKAQWILWYIGQAELGDGPKSWDDAIL